VHINILILAESLNHLSWALTIDWLLIKVLKLLKSNLLPMPLALIIVLPSFVLKCVLH